MSTADDREFIGKMKIVGTVVGVIGSTIGGFIWRKKKNEKKDKDKDG